MIPYLCLPGQCGAAADFYVEAFGASADIGRMPMDGKPGEFMHLQLEINGGALMLTDYAEMSSAQGGTDPIPRGHLQLVVPDGQAWRDRAVAAGCTVVAPYERQFWGDTCRPSVRSLRAEMGGADARSCALGEGRMSFARRKKPA